MPAPPDPATTGAATEAAGAPTPSCPTALVVPGSANQTSPCGPAAIPVGELPALRPVLNSVIVPLGVMRPIALVGPSSANQRLPSGPAAKPRGELTAGSPLLNSVI